MTGRALKGGFLLRGLDRGGLIFLAIIMGVGILVPALNLLLPALCQPGLQIDQLDCTHSASEKKERPAVPPFFMCGTSSY